MTFVTRITVMTVGLEFDKFDMYSFTRVLGLTEFEMATKMV